MRDGGMDTGHDAFIADLRREPSDVYIGPSRMLVATCRCPRPPAHELVEAGGLRGKVVLRTG